jgi:DNA-binding MarR family transcriptional regulator
MLTGLTELTVIDSRATIEPCRPSLLYNGQFRALTPRECAYVLALSDLGAGSHTVGEIAESLGSTSERLSSIRNRLVEKEVLFVPSVGMVEFRIPLTDRYVRRHRTELERRSANARTAMSET